MSAVEDPKPKHGRRSVRVRIAALGLVLLAVALYWPVSSHDFIDVDDYPYVVDNPAVNRGFSAASVLWAFRSTELANWHPLTWLSHMLDVQLFGMNPGSHHVVNFALHAANGALLLSVLVAATGALWPSLLVAALFVSHPLHVQSVAWVAERKDLLCGLFWMLTLRAYILSVRRPSRGLRAAVAVLFALGLMSKPMMVTLPFVLLLLDFWPLNRFDGAGKSARSGGVWPLVIEKLPLFVLSAAAAATAFLAQQRGGAVQHLDLLPVGARAMSAVNSWGWYLVKMLAPSGLAIFYPPAPARLFPWTAFTAVALAAGLLVAGRMRANRPYVLTGWLWYLGTLVPVIGLVRVGAPATADRYAYLPLIGMYLLLAWSARDAAAGNRRVRGVLVTTAVLALAATAVATRAQVHYWKDSFTLFSRATQITEKNWLAYNVLGVALGRAGRHGEAIEAYRSSLQFEPGAPLTWFNLGAEYTALGRPEPAVAAYLNAERLDPDRVEPLLNLGVEYARLGRLSDAAEYYRKVLRVAPHLARAHLNLGLLHQRLGHFPEARDAFLAALRERPDNAEARYSLALAYLELGDRDAALREQRLLEPLSKPLADRLIAALRR